MTSPAELQAIRERDARWLPHRPQNTVADYDRRTLLALYDAQSDEVRRLREALDAAQTNARRYEWLRQAPCAQLQPWSIAKRIGFYGADKHFEQWLQLNGAALDAAIDAALGSQP